MLRLILFVILIITIGYFLGWGNVSKKTITFLNDNKTTIEKGADLVDKSSKIVVKKLKEVSKETQESVDEIVDEDSDNLKPKEEKPDLDNKVKPKKNK